jgi:HprK-related kinase A
MISAHPHSTLSAAEAPIHVRIGDIDVSLRSEFDEVAEDFAALYRGCRRDEPPCDETIRMEVRSGKRSILGRQRYVVCGDGNVMGKQRRREEVFPYLEWAINWRIIARRRDLLQLHAATMVRDGQGFIFAGSSGSGKSTLVAGLLARGWSYLSDEFALIDPETMNLHAFPKAVCIKQGSFDLVESLNLPFSRDRYHVKAFKGAVAYVSPHDLAPPAIGRPSPIRYVIFPKYTEGRPPRLQPIPRSQAAFALAGCAFNRSIFGPRTMTILSDVVRKSECFALTSGDLAQTCDLIESLLTVDCA